MRSATAEDYVEAFRRRCAAMAPPGSEHLDRPGVVGYLGVDGGSPVGRLLITDDAALDVIAEREADLELQLAVVFDSAPRAGEFFQGSARFRLSETGAAMVAVDLRDLTERPLPDGVAAHAVDLDGADPDGVTLEAAVARAKEFDTADAGLPDDLIVRFLRSLPHVTVLVAVDRAGSVVATAASGVIRGDAAVFFVTTDPAMRGRGIATAMTSAVLMHAKNRGAVAGSFDASVLGEPIYRKLGFTRVAGISRYVPR